tara:strand:+ start:7368 stop:8360 length:993 start_codon:yes stop_codon:yes gene_type:complete
MFSDQDGITVDTSDPQYLELKSLLEQQKIEWKTQKTALEKLVKSEENLAFLIDALSTMSVIGNSPSLEQYMRGQPQYIQDDETEVENKSIAVNGSQMVNSRNSSTSNTAINVSNVNSGNTSYSNPLAPLADSPEELALLMTELQKLARTQRYYALKEKKVPGPAQSASIESNELGRYTSSHGGIFANSKVQLSDYTRQLAGKLAKFTALEGSTVGVASFVDFNETLRSSSSLGNQFAEGLATELPSYGVSVVDFKMTKYIEVSAMGDLALSRDGQKLNGQTNMDYVLTGTLVATHRGVKINSRVVSVEDNSVIAAASIFVPQGLLQQIQP